MPGKVLLIGPVLLVAVSIPADADKAPATKDDLYPIYEHGEGRWLAFDAPLRVRQDLETPGLHEYKLKLTVSVLVREGRQAEVRFTFAEEGTFKDALRPELPSSTHVDLVIGERSSVAVPLTAAGFTAFGGSVRSPPASRQSPYIRSRRWSRPSHCGDTSAGARRTER